MKKKLIDVKVGTAVLSQAGDSSTLKTGKLDVGIASELHNNVGKQMGLIKLQLEYATLRGEKHEIKFLDKTEVKV